MVNIVLELDKLEFILFEFLVPMLGACKFDVRLLGNSNHLENCEMNFEYPVIFK